MRLRWPSPDGDGKIVVQTKPGGTDRVEQGKAQGEAGS